MNILAAVSEAVPYVKTGGLADVVGSLYPEMARMGHHVRLFLPLYKSIPRDNLELVFEHYSVEVAGAFYDAAVYKQVISKNFEVYFVQHNYFFHREGLYGDVFGGYKDNPERYMFFCKAVLEIAQSIGFQPDVVHAHDWQTGMLPAYLRTSYSESLFYKDTACVFTIHNLAYQGNCDKSYVERSGIGWENFTVDKMEFYDQLSFLKGGLCFADRINTVSPTYAQQIQTPEYGFGLHRYLHDRRDILCGIINGIDAKDWQVSGDPAQPASYSTKSLKGKEVCKQHLLAHYGLDYQVGRPLVGIVSRLVSQKGCDLLLESLSQILQEELSLVILGSGDRGYEQALRAQAALAPDKMAVQLGFDIDQAKRIYAGCDIFLMPSYYEPCGLSQLISMCYGTVPLVRETGGLADTVVDYHINSTQGCGFSFVTYREVELIRALRRTLCTYRNHKKEWKRIQLRGMKSDFSWRVSAQKYIDLYHEAGAK